MKPTVILTQDQIDFFHREGYLAIDAITTKEEVQKMRVIYDALFEQKAGLKDGSHFDLAGSNKEGAQAVLPQISGPSKYAPELLTTLFRVNAHAIVCQLLGQDVECHYDHAILKPGGRSAPTPWHQDESYWSPALEYQRVNVWMPLQEATLENGCMQFIPGSHKLEVLPHHSINNDPATAGLEVDMAYVDESRAVACPLPEGGATFHLGRTLHYTSTNLTNHPRRSYSLVFGTTPKPRSTPREFKWQAEKEVARQERIKRAAEKTTAS